MLKIDNTKRSDFNTCPRKYYYLHERNLRSSFGSTALRYGSVWHKCLEGYYTEVKNKGWENGDPITAAILAGKKAWDSYGDEGQEFYNDYRTIENMMQALLEYVNYFTNDETMLEVLEVENVFKIEMDPGINDRDLFKDLEPFYFTGIIDLEILLNGRPWTVEHKTTGSPLSVQSKRLRRTAQNIGYSYAAKQKLEEPPEGTLIVLHHLSSYKSKKTGLYGKPKIEFERIPEIYGDDDYHNWKMSLFDTVDRIQREVEQRWLWPMNFDSCYNFGQCGFTPLCEQGRELGDEITDGFVEVEHWDVTKRMKEKPDYCDGCGQVRKGAVASAIVGAHICHHCGQVIPHREKEDDLQN